MVPSGAAGGILGSVPGVRTVTDVGVIPFEVTVQAETIRPMAMAAPRDSQEPTP